MRGRLAMSVLFLGTLRGLTVGAAPLRVLFLHHSTGGNLLREGEVREALSARGYEVWDHGYNDEGLADAAGMPVGRSFGIPDDNTNPDGWAAVFSQDVASSPGAFAQMLEYDVILFKSCFPASNIEDDEMAASYKRSYLEIRTVIDRHPDRLFVAFTPPPLVPNETTSENAARARAWSAYLASEEFAGGRINLVVFDFFSLLADPAGFLRAEYRSGEGDSHPNALANRAVGPLLAAAVDAAILRWRDGAKSRQDPMESNESTSAGA
ncbi:MAG: hypothetical protein AB1778_04995 [Candidatus Bipolaricaulota bacterium]